MECILKANKRPVFSNRNNSTLSNSEAQFLNDLTLVSNTAAISYKFNEQTILLQQASALNIHNTLVHTLGNCKSSD